MQMFLLPREAHPCAEPRLLTYFHRCSWWRLVCRDF